MPKPVNDINSASVFSGNRASGANRQNSSNKSTIFQETGKKTKRIHTPPIDFICNNYTVVKQIGEAMSNKFGASLFQKEQRSKIEAEAREIVMKILAENNLVPADNLTAEYLKLIYADILGLGMLEPLLEDKEIDEIMVKNYDCIFVEKHGLIQKSNYRFASFAAAEGVVKRIIEPLNKTLNVSHPNVDAQLPDGSRLSASIPPLRANGEISITIRKFKDTVEPLMYYCQKFKSSTPEMVKFIEEAVRSRISIIVSGGTGSGKTTLLNACSIAIPENERIITIEDTLELKLQQEHVEAYQTIEKNVEGKGGFTAQDCVKMALRKRPDRIIVGECRGGEFVEMLNAMNTGHEGSMSTIHANSPADFAQRAQTMILSNPDTKSLHTNAMCEMINSAIDLIIQTNRYEDGSRKITSITEIVGFGQDGYNKLRNKGQLSSKAAVDKNKLYLQDIFKFKLKKSDEPNKVVGVYEATGYVPFCFDKMKAKGTSLDESFFEKRVLMEVK